jgi:hypothetical protein
MANTKEELQRKKQLAYTLYVENGFEQKVIANVTGISEKSISLWKKKDKESNIDWDADRIELKQGFDKERRRIKKHINNILDNIEAREDPYNVPSAPEGDTINKLSVSAKNLQTELSFAHKSETGKQFIAYIQQVHGQAKAIEIVDLWHEFLMGTS